MSNPDLPLSVSPSDQGKVGRSARSAFPAIRVRAALAGWALPLTLAALVGLVLLATPWRGTLSMRIFDTEPGTVGLNRLMLGIANITAIVAVLLSRHRIWLASALAAVPWLLSPLAATMAWGWWLAGLAVLAVAMFDGARRRALPISALVVGLAVAYCTTGMYWNVPLTGPVSFDPGPGCSGAVVPLSGISGLV
jgi:hypothetical protein